MWLPGKHGFQPTQSKNTPATRSLRSRLKRVSGCIFINFGGPNGAIRTLSRTLDLPVYCRASPCSDCLSSDAGLTPNQINASLGGLYHEYQMETEASEWMMQFLTTADDGGLVQFHPSVPCVYEAERWQPP